MFAQRGSLSVVEAAYLGFVFNAVQIGLFPGSAHVPHEAGEDLVGKPAQQERVGTLEDFIHDRPGLGVEVRPSAALE